MLGLRFAHLGIACADIDATAEFVQRAFVVESDSGTVHDPVQDAYVRLFNAGLPTAVELVAGPVVASLVKRHVAAYHVCYHTPDLERSIAQAHALGVHLLREPAPAVLFGGRRVAFMYAPLGMLEFLED